MIRWQVQYFLDFFVIEGAHEHGTKAARSSLKIDVLCHVTHFHVSVAMSAAAVFSSAALINARDYQYCGRAAHPLLTERCRCQRFAQVAVRYMHQFVSLRPIAVDASRQAFRIARNHIEFEGVERPSRRGRSEAAPGRDSLGCP